MSEAKESMPDNSDLQLRPIRRALISVSDKTGIVEFVRELKRLEVEIVSTGGTARTLREAGIEVRDVSDITDFPEMMDGRVKTLHPRIHGGLLGLRDNQQHLTAMCEHGIKPIDLVVLNLYPFEETVARREVLLAEAIEQIDIGGPALIRSAAKNYRDVAIVVGTEWYEEILSELKRNSGALTLSTRQRLALRAFMCTSRYDNTIEHYLLKQFLPEIVSLPVQSNDAPPTGLPDDIQLVGEKISDLRYGENPHQAGALYALEDAPAGLAQADLLSGKEMSFNNYVDADAAWQLVCDFEETACAIIKHTNPAGVGLGKTAADAYRKALATDPLSAFGGIVAFNRRVDPDAAQEVTKIFTEVVIAPDYDQAALDILRTKKNLRVIHLSSFEATSELEYRQIGGGMLAQTKDSHRLRRDHLKVVTTRQPTEEEIRSLLFAWTVCKHTKSNAIVYARADQTVGVGAGQMSRVDSVKIGAMRARLQIAGSVLASDAFFPFRDGLDEAAKHGITAVIQPGGSVRDEEVIAAANEHGLAMIFTGIRHFKH